MKYLQSVDFVISLTVFCFSQNYEKTFWRNLACFCCTKLKLLLHENHLNFKKTKVYACVNCEYLLFPLIKHVHNSLFIFCSHSFIPSSTGKEATTIFENSPTLTMELQSEPIIKSFECHGTCAI